MLNMNRIARNKVLKDTAEQFVKKSKHLSEVADIAICGSVLVYKGRICHRRECPGRSIDCSDPNRGKTPHLRNEPDFDFDESRFLESPFEIMYQTTETSSLLLHKKQLGITSLRTYTALKALKVKCVECGRRFTIDGGEQKWFTKRGLNLPKRC
jgi:hypothetical protein